ncbi:hypothetical protein LDENG_00228760 [Lucifuga dentata]|nr:hypothetical protein LDENG_00228760 [Lucifuga dentata]
MITDREITRQKDDLTFAQLLNRIRVKQKENLSEAGNALLSQAVKSPANCPH